MRTWAERRPDSCALTQRDTELTWGALFDAVSDLRRRLAGAGVEPGDRVAILGANSVEWVLAFLAALARGAVTVPLNNRLSAGEVNRQLEISAPRVVLAASDLAEKVALGRMRVLGLEREGEDSIFRSAPGPDGEFSWAREAPAVISFTSGTTGTPKGAVISYGALHASAGAYIDAFETDVSDRTLVMVPLFHNTGFVDQLLQILLVGGSVDVLPEFSVRGATEALARRPASYLIAVPSIYRLLMLSEGAEAAFVRCRTAAFGGSVMPQAWIDELNDRWPEMRLFNVYGLTEFTSVSHILGPEHPPELADSVGAPVREVRHRVVTEAGEPLPVGVIGEIELAGPTRMLRYWRNAAATESALRDGWLRTGDLGSIDECGFLRVRGRAGDVINRGGEKIHAAQVEMALGEVAWVRAAAVVGAPHPIFQECVVACVELTSGAKLDRLDLDRRLSESIPDFALPEHYVVVDELPLNAAGKVNRQAVRALAERAVTEVD